MHTFVKVGAGTTLLTGMGVGGYFVNDYLAVRISARLQGTKVNGESDWAKKAEALKLATSTELVDDLSKLSKVAKEIEKWCKTSYDAKFKDKDDLRFKNVQAYCIYNNKDKLPDGTISEKEEWTKANEALKGKQQDTELSPTMKDIKAKLSKSPTTELDALKKWCVSYYGEIWTGDNNENFKDAKTYCVKTV
ncbi:hypothetical protein A6V39_03400 [Candidatus Mycoplasma haematobovis]|uniref:Uncharacterized protein n=1 Tax=Candidatus Mycoplasma haematobovis TaxID=432608 RepID=A0A1A9QD43_9MOLU|nr:hypothetical protein [Candidatus Mycoplasma haematobovis]OAL09931.1 hypothetical protein A6V39_03400 [Candidatus Mycoplasma haematobovis]